MKPDTQFMDLAIDLAKKERPHPNPQVGAILVKGSRIVGQGAHREPGGPHAEIAAIHDAGAHARGADLYVTLEPCCHQGRTGPCTEAIHTAGIRNIFVGIEDPDRHVQGQGIERLRALGHQVTIGIAKEPITQMLEAYIHHRQTGRPLFTLKAAVTLDGYLATTTYDSKWISSEQSRQKAHELRAANHGVLVGRHTVEHDNPMLDVRYVNGPNPTRIVLDTNLTIPLDSKLLTTAERIPTIVAHAQTLTETVTSRYAAIAGVTLLPLPVTDRGRIELESLGAQLGELGFLSVLVEGGGMVHGAFIKSGLADKLALFVAPTILGSGTPWATFPGSVTVEQGVHVTQLSARQIGPDIYIKGHFNR